jgi:hypothetical protein
MIKKQGKEAPMSEDRDNNKAEERISNELANQAASEPNSPENEDAKEKRGQAEREITQTRDHKP